MADVHEVAELGHHGAVDHADGEAQTRVRHDQVVDSRSQWYLKSAIIEAYDSFINRIPPNDMYFYMALYIIIILTHIRQKPMTNRPMSAANHLQIENIGIVAREISFELL